NSRGCRFDDFEALSGGKHLFNVEVLVFPDDLKLPAVVDRTQVDRIAIRKIDGHSIVDCVSAQLGEFQLHSHLKEVLSSECLPRELHPPELNTRTKKLRTQDSDLYYQPEYRPAGGTPQPGVRRARRTQCKDVQAVAPGAGNRRFTGIVFSGWWFAGIQRALKQFRSKFKARQARFAYVIETAIRVARVRHFC